jgi:hypothetical protein
VIRVSILVARQRVSRVSQQLDYSDVDIGCLLCPFGELLAGPTQHLLLLTDLQDCGVVANFVVSGRLRRNAMAACAFAYEGNGDDTR